MMGKGGYETLDDQDMSLWGTAGQCIVCALYQSGFHQRNRTSGTYILTHAHAHTHMYNYIVQLVLNKKEIHIIYN